jgi:hypothetical protein
MPSILKRALIIMRRASWPERDKVNDMIRTDSPLITPEVKLFCAMLTIIVSRLWI